MKFARYNAHGETAYGVVEDGLVKRLTASPFDDYEVTDHTHPLTEVKLLSPCYPGKIIAIGLNYKSHLGDREPPKVPEPFFKTPSCVIGPGDSIVLPKDATKVQEEAELTVVMGKTCKGATEADALSYVMGYTCGNDVSERHWQRDDLQWWRAKSSDTFGPIGPYIVTDLDPSDLDIRARVDGHVVQDSNTSDLLYGVPTIIARVSRVLTLDPGDLIMTGTPGQPVDLHAGETVEIEIEGIGVLTNPVVAE